MGVIWLSEEVHISGQGWQTEAAEAWAVLEAESSSLGLHRNSWARKTRSRMPWSSSQVRGTGSHGGIVIRPQPSNGSGYPELHSEMLALSFKILLSSSPLLYLLLSFPFLFSLLIFFLLYPSSCSSEWKIQIFRINTRVLLRDVAACWFDSQVH